MLPPSRMQCPLPLKPTPNWNSLAWEESVEDPLSSVCSPASPNLANCPRQSCSWMHWSGYLRLGTTDGCMWAMPPYPWWSDWIPQWACCEPHTTCLLAAWPWLLLGRMTGWASSIGTNLVTGSLRTLQPGQHRNVASIGGVRTMIGMSVRCSGDGWSLTGELMYALKYKAWSDDSSAYSSLDLAWLA